jgi:hypothetical protein
MAVIATLSDLASFLRVDVATITDRQILLDLAQGLVIDVVGVQTPWSVTTKAVVLGAAARAYYNPEGLRSVSVDDGTIVYAEAGMGVYLTSAEATRLEGGSARLPRFEFPAPDYTWSASTATVVSG